MNELSLFNNICVKCMQYDAIYDCYCDGCASDFEYAWCIFLQKKGFKDYSEAVHKIGRKKIDYLFSQTKLF